MSMYNNGYKESYNEAKNANDSLNKEVIKVNLLQVGFIISMEGYTFTVTDIHEYQENKWSTPRLLLTGYNNINDNKKLYTIDYSILDYVTIINNI